jgi:phosphopantothenoylcysteine decarboxylase/phosphopantothenate--cysteine ligase
MNDKMFAHPQVQANLAHCRDVLGYRIAGPATGPLAVGEADGPGRMLEPETIVQHVGRALAGGSALQGKRVLVTSGPTREAVDPVRFVGNRSSGRMGRSLAEAAWRRGAEVTVVSGPVALEHPVGAEVVRVETGLEMRDAVHAELSKCTVFIASAAVADFRPATRAARKPGAVVVGFALETENLVENAKKKLDAKGFDLIVANPAGVPGAGFESETNQVTLIARDGANDLPSMDKDEVADAVLDRVEALLAKR